MFFSIAALLVCACSSACGRVSILHSTIERNFENIWLDRGNWKMKQCCGLVRHAALLVGLELAAFSGLLQLKGFWKGKASYIELTIWHKAPHWHCSFLLWLTIVLFSQQDKVSTCTFPWLPRLSPLCSPSCNHSIYLLSWQHGVIITPGTSIKQLDTCTKTEKHNAADFE